MCRIALGMAADTACPTACVTAQPPQHALHPPTPATCATVTRVSLISVTSLCLMSCFMIAAPSDHRREISARPTWRRKGRVPTMVASIRAAMIRGGAERGSSLAHGDHRAPCAFDSVITQSDATRYKWRPCRRPAPASLRSAVGGAWRAGCQIGRSKTDTAPWACAQRSRAFRPCPASGRENANRRPILSGRRKNRPLPAF